MTRSTSKRKKSEITREAILESASELFQQKSYDQVGVREIASRAGVDAAMVNRYFGSKMGLFDELFSELEEYDELYDVPLSELGERLARFVIEGELRTRAGVTLPIRNDRTLTILRSVGCQEALPMLRDVIAKRLTGPLLRALADEEQAVEKVALIVSSCFGFILIHRMIGAACVMEADRDTVKDLLSKNLQAIIDA